jgi:hypothetical protein
MVVFWWAGSSSAISALSVAGKSAAALFEWLGQIGGAG